jgi:hypothetical protein
MKACTMSQLWSFIGQKKNREILAWIGGGLAVAIAGLWTALVYFSTPDKTTTSSPNVEASCGSVGVGGSVSGTTITASNAGNCPEPKP